MQDGKKPIIQSIRDYVMTYPDIDDRKINIDYLGNGMEYSIDPIGADPIYTISSRSWTVTMLYG